MGIEGPELSCPGSSVVADKHLTWRIHDDRHTNQANHAADSLLPNLNAYLLPNVLEWCITTRVHSFCHLFQRSNNSLRNPFTCRCGQVGNDLVAVVHGLDANHLNVNT